MRVLGRTRRHGGDGARAVALVAASLIAVAGCGGDDDGGEPEPAPVTTGTAPPTQSAPTQPATTGESDEQLIRAAIEGALASGDPSRACDRSVTQAYVVSVYGDRAGCDAAQASGGAAKSVRASGIAISGDEATAVAVPAGGPSNGESLDVSLVREGETWKVDSLRSDIPVGP